MRRPLFHIISGKGKAMDQQKKELYRKNRNKRVETASSKKPKPDKRASVATGKIAPEDQPGRVENGDLFESLLITN